MAPTRQGSAAQTSASGLTLGIILACQLMIVLDVTVLYTAMPHIESALHFTLATLSWVQSAYTLGFGGLMLLGARTGDILGRRRVFIAAIALFTLASLAGGLAQSAEGLLIARAVQGIAAAFAAPSTLALMMTSFPEGHERNRAVRLYTAVSGAGGAIGLVLGGLLTDAVSWRWVMFINLPIGLGLLILAPLCLQETERHRGRFDLAGALTVTFGSSALVYGLIRAVTDGWADTLTGLSFAAGAALLAAFVWVERRAAQPITPLHLFASTERSGAYAGRILLIGGNLGTFFFLTQYVQTGLGYSALNAGFAFLALVVPQVLMSTYGVRRLLPLVGHRLLLAGGLALAVAGMVGLSRIGVDISYFPQLAVPLVILGIGTGAAFVPLTTAGIAGVAPRDAGAASGLVNTAHQLGGSLGTAVIVAIVGPVGDPAAGPLVDGVASHLAVRSALTHALTVSATASAAFFALALAVALLTMRRAGSLKPAVPSEGRAG
ncbi:MULTISPECIES: MFS transporter [unclassified Inquilinus]|uniref:MFS transporter n=1 Tax=unclassified Inquilinus TaxID=2645927 RepID=UPI003F91BA47